MDLAHLFVAEQVDALAGALQAQRQVVAGLLLAVGLQGDDMEALLLVIVAQRRQSLGGLRLAEQEHVGAAFLGPLGEHQQFGQRLAVQQLGVVHQQEHRLAGLRQLLDMPLDGGRIGGGQSEHLGNLQQQGLGAAAGAGVEHHRQHRLLVAGGDQRLAQQGLAAAQRAAHQQQQLAVAGQVQQLGEQRLALRRKELEVGHPRGEGVMAELVVAEEHVLGVKVAHDSIS